MKSKNEICTYERQLKPGNEMGKILYKKEYVVIALPSNLSNEAAPERDAEEGTPNAQNFQPPCCGGP